MVYVSLVTGLLLLLASGEFLIRGAVAIASRLGVSPLFIGLTLVGFGTSSPELMASVIAALKDAPGIAVGNVVGSNIANILLILGCAAVVRPAPGDGQSYRRDAWSMLAATLLLVAAALIGAIDRLTGALLLVALCGYVLFTYRTERVRADAGAAMHAAEAEIHTAPRWSFKRAAVVTLASLAGVIGGAALLVRGAIGLARLHAIPETVIGLTMVAIGTSLPELVVAVLAARRGASDVAVGNVLGSNIYNVLFILGATALIHPIAVPADLLHYDVWIMLATALALILFVHFGRPITRGVGIAFLVAYAAYVATLIG
jgi:cation:H+ antiporter